MIVIELFVNLMQCVCGSCRVLEVSLFVFVDEVARCV